MAQVQFDREKMRAVILRTCHACHPSDLGAVKLHKVLYYLDMLMYAHHQQVVTGATYRKRPNGPMADQLLFSLRDMTVAGDLRVDNTNYHGFLKREYCALRPEPEGILNESEVTLLDDVIDFVCRKHTAKSISDYSHALPWEMAEMGGEIPYHTAMLLFPMQPSPEAFDAAEQGMSEIEVARSQSSAVGMRSLSAFRGSVLAAIGQR
jgi:hypothetical protein